jgi:hypothetical protein
MRRARALVLAALTLVGGWAPRLPAQTPAEPRLVLSVLAGYRAGQHLWSLTGQPYAVLVHGMTIF